MKILYALFLLVFLVIGLYLSYVSSGSREEQAGIAFAVGENGELVEIDGARINDRTEISKRDDGSDAEWLTKWVLTERSGLEVGSEDLEGEPYVAGFFFSTCPSICFQQNTRVQQLQEEFQDEAIKFLSISCDPEVDRPEVLQKYAQRFNADEKQWLFLTGKMDYIRRVGAEIFSLGVVRKGHPEKFALMDKNGDMVGLYTWSEDQHWDRLRADIAKLVDAGGAMVTEKDGTEQANAADEEGAAKGSLQGAPAEKAKAAGQDQSEESTP